jgi:hypothetical protein
VKKRASGDLALHELTSNNGDDLFLRHRRRLGRPAPARAERVASLEEGNHDKLTALLERAERPTERERWESYVAARQEAESVDQLLFGARAYGVMKPPELDGYQGPRDYQGSGGGGGLADAYAQ